MGGVDRRGLVDGGAGDVTGRDAADGVRSRRRPLDDVVAPPFLTPSTAAPSVHALMCGGRASLSDARISRARALRTGGMSSQLIPGTWWKPTLLLRSLGNEVACGAIWVRMQM